jgi:hypothetical protein
VKEYAPLMRDLVRAHPLMMRVAERRWLEHLDRLANADIEEIDLARALEARLDAQWIVIDALGLLAAEAVDGVLPGWRLEEVGYSLAPEATTTDAFNRMLAESGIEHAFAKIDALDRIVHERTLPLDDLLRIARAEIGAELSRIAPRVERERPLLLFGDHGFRLAKDGRRWVHGGGSTLERLVPMFRFA